jgi:hypothetical protein
MFEFLEYIKTYIQNAFANDSDITTDKKPLVYNAYQSNHEPSADKPEIQIQVLDNNEATRYTTFTNVNANSIPLQITAYVGGNNGIKIANITRSAQQGSIIFGDKIIKYLNDLIYNGLNENILGGRNIATSPALPMNDGATIYMTAVRFDFTIASPYVVD